MSTFKKLLIIFLSIISTSELFSQSDLKKSICMVRPEYSDSQRKMFDEYNDLFKSKGFSNIYDANDKSFNTGFVVQSQSGINYVISCFSSVNYSESASVEFIGEEGNSIIYDNLIISGVDKESGIVLIRLDHEIKNVMPLSFSKITPKEGTVVFQGGYVRSKDFSYWKYRNGIINNAFLNFNQNINKYTTFIMHSMYTTNELNGSPLLYKDNNTSGGHSVLGLCEREYGEHGYSAIPSSVIEDLINRVETQSLPQDYASIQSKAQRVADLFSNDPNNDKSFLKFLSPQINDTDLNIALVRKYFSSTDNASRNDIRENKDNFIIFYTSMMFLKNIRKEFYQKKEQKPAFTVKAVEITGNNANVIFKELISNKEFSTKWIYEKGEWNILDLQIENEISQFEQQKKEISDSSAINFKFGMPYYLRSKSSDYKNSAVENTVKNFNDLTLCWDFNFNYLLYSIGLDYIVSDYDTIKLYSTDIGLHHNFKINKFIFDPYAKAGLGYTILSDDAAWSWNAEAGINFIMLYNKKINSEGIGIGASVKYTDINTRNNNCQNYENLSLNFNLIFPISVLY